MGSQTSRMPRKPDNETSPVADFEQSLDALEQLVEKMEHGEMSLEESLCVGVALSGYYVRTATSPTAQELAQFVCELPAPQ